MGPLTRYSALESGVRGVKRELEHFDQAAASVLKESTAHHERAPDPVEISDAARNDAASERSDLPDGGEHLGPGLEGALIDTRIAKYSMIANLKTLQTADEMSKELLRTFDPKDR
jgi:hypothetical protein